MGNLEDLYINSINFPSPHPVSNIVISFFPSIKALTTGKNILMRKRAWQHKTAPISREIFFHELLLADHKAAFYMLLVH